MSNVIPFEADEVGEVLESASEIDWGHLVVIGFSKEGDLVIGHTGMDCIDMLWLSEQLRDLTKE
jgi:hypothetical protein